MKIRETQKADGGFMGPRLQVRVRELKKDEPMPEGAKTVPDETPVTDWQNEDETK